MRAGKAELLSAHTVSRGSSSHAKWFLLNASPDLRMQIVGAAELNSRRHLCDLKAVSERGVRHSPIVGCGPHRRRSRSGARAFASAGARANSHLRDGFHPTVAAGAKHILQHAHRVALAKRLDGSCAGRKVRACSIGGIYQQAGLPSYIPRWRSSGLHGRKTGGGCES